MVRTVADLLVGVLERLEPAFHRTRPQRPRPYCSAIPLRSWAPRSCSSNKLPISFRVLSALIVVAERTDGSSHQRK